MTDEPDLRTLFLQRLKDSLNAEELSPAALEVVRKTLNDLGELKIEETEEEDPDVKQLREKYELIEGGKGAAKTG